MMARAWGRRVPSIGVVLCGAAAVVIGALAGQVATSRAAAGASGGAAGAGATSATAAAPAPCTPPAHVGVVFIVDDSGSMWDNDPSNIRGQGVAIGMQQMRDGTLVAASTFTDGVTSIFGPTPVSASNRTLLSHNVIGALHSNGGTDYQAAFAEAQRQLGAMPANTQKAVVFLSDGEPNDPSFTSDLPIDAEHVPIFTIGIGAADPSILQAIADRSGGSMLTVHDVGNAQPAFAQIVSGLECDTPAINTTSTLAPGRSVTSTFTVGSGVQSLLGLAAWSSGAHVSVTLTRPDGSTVSVGHLRPGEVFNLGTAYDDLTATPPMAGTWHVTLTAAPSNGGPVDVTFEAWTRGALTPTSPQPPLPAGVVPASTSWQSMGGSVTHAGLPRGVTGLSCGQLRTSWGDHRTLLLAWPAYVAPQGDVTYAVSVAPMPLGRYPQWTQAWSGTDLTASVTGMAKSHWYEVSVVADVDGTPTTSVCLLTVTPPWWSVRTGTSGDDVITSADGEDLIDGGAGNDIIDVPSGNLTVYGGPGNDTITTTGGRTIVDGGAGNDSIDVADGAPDDKVTCGPGVDTVTADVGDLVARDCEHVTYM
jgi:hypothetical protein